MKEYCLYIFRDNKPYDVRIVQSGDEYQLHFEQEYPDVRIKKDTDGLWIQCWGAVQPPEIIASAGKYIDEVDNKGFSFPFDYEGKTVTCRIIFKEDVINMLFQVHFDQRLVAELFFDDDAKWKSTKPMSLIDSQTIESVGEKIDTYKRGKSK